MQRRLLRNRYLPIVQSAGNTYHPETYWNSVAGQISLRGDGNYIAGDDEPFYRYKRKRFLQLFNSISFKNKTVLEVGCGPGGNLAVAALQNPAKLTGIDLSSEMLSLAKRNLSGRNIDLFHISDHTFPFQAGAFDLVFTSTVLQHTTDDRSLLATIAEMCRVSNSDIYIFERIEKTIKGNESCLGRTVGFYQQIFQEHGFELLQKRFLHIEASYVLAGLTRKFLNRGKRKEGEKLSAVSVAVQRLLLPVTRAVDKLYKVDRDLAMLHFKLRKNG